MNELKSTARILSTGQSPRLVAEVVQDIVRRGSSPAELFRLGQYVGTYRLAHSAAKEDFIAIEHMLQAIEDNSQQLYSSLALVSGLTMCLLESKHPLSAKAARQSIHLVRQLHAPLNADLLVILQSLLSVLVTDPKFVISNSSQVVWLLVKSLPLHHLDASQVSVLSKLISQSDKSIAPSLCQYLHSYSIDLLLANEPHQTISNGSSEPLLVVIESVLRHFSITSIVWCQLVDTLGCLHFLTTQHTREGTTTFHSICQHLIQHGLSLPHLDSLIRALFTEYQPCLRHLQATNPIRQYTVLFYLDLLEHLVPQLTSHTIQQMVLPLACHYVQRPEDPWWFESAHALVLSILDSSHSVDISQWYCQLLLSQYPQMGISAELLRIAYTASIRSSASYQGISMLLERIDSLSTNGSKVRQTLDNVERRELMSVLVQQLTSVDSQHLPILLRDIETRSNSTTLDEIQKIILVDLDVNRKATLSKWILEFISTHQINHSVC